MKTIKSIDLWTEQYENHYECFNGAFVDGFENNKIAFDEYKIIDSSKQDDYRINIIIDGRYVLRINNPIITEGCLLAIERLVERYDCIRVKAPKLLKNDN